MCLYSYPQVLHPPNVEASLCILWWLPLSSDSHGEPSTSAPRLDGASFSMDFLAACTHTGCPAQAVGRSSTCSHRFTEASPHLAQRTPLPPSPTLSQEFEYQSLLSFNNDETPSPSRPIYIYVYPCLNFLPVSFVALIIVVSFVFIPHLSALIAIFDQSTRPETGVSTTATPTTKWPRLSSLSSSPDFPDMVIRCGGPHHIIFS
ncbi:hypothetical protein B0H13DRAFT_2387803 [Mycena leptocephala]|nr:hypothetical protein B0H13DRAFT_2387803 [Mycena leptocephala]